ncbi:MAG TPA: ferrochelatase [Alphaproteobacteria bacterium]|nr:ferrochelatase [Alphaproteobacteria bacterium]
MSRIAVVLFNLGGPDGPEAVKPFLRNLFSDPAILRVPALLRRPLAAGIAGRRAVAAREIYAKLGGGSPLLANSLAQAQALQTALGAIGDVRAFVCMRYWKPRAEQVASEVKEFDPKRLVLLPLYPQFSTTTTGSSFADWQGVAQKVGLAAAASAICCYPTEAGFIAALAQNTRQGLDSIGGIRNVRLLLTAHGLPERVIAAGDPYQRQVEETAAALVRMLGLPELDWQLCYQSRVGPLRWIGPATDDEIRRAGREGRAVVVAPIAFVSEHSETLVELDIEYAHLAREAGVPVYRRVPTVSTSTHFIEGLAELVREALARGPGLASSTGTRHCPHGYRGCALGHS